MENPVNADPRGGKRERLTQYQRKKEKMSENWGFK
jgi:hypothetical protein